SGMVIGRINCRSLFLVHHAMQHPNWGHDAAGRRNIPGGLDRGRLAQCAKAAARLAEPSLAQRAEAGGAEGIRTPDLPSAIAALSELSSGPAAGTKRPITMPAFGEFGPFRAVMEACQWPRLGGRLPRSSIEPSAAHHLGAGALLLVRRASNR